MPGYAVERVTMDGMEAVRLRNEPQSIQATILPALGNNSIEFASKGQNYMFTGGLPPSQIKERRRLCGNPLLAPWANRLLPSSFPANGRTYLLQEQIGNLRKDPNGLPIHGLLAFSDAWEVMRADAFEDRAEVQSRLEFWRYPELMAQWPFAHTLFMTYILRGTELEVETVIENHSHEPMPVAVGYHPYFQLPGSPRSNWKAKVPARRATVMSKTLTPSGNTRPFDDPQPLDLGQQVLDNIFEDLITNSDGRAEFSVSDGTRTLTVTYGPQYPVAVVYAPSGQEFICFEPMTGVTNQLNLAAEGKYPALPNAPALGSWKESFWIRIDEKG